ncbi:MAG: VOC family protein [Planctomycetes bacterium]|nr:VOC family protein [Planctomycetota bacterium]
MACRLSLVALLVREYDEAIAFYVSKLGFELVEDTDLGAGKRWVRVRPPDSEGAELLLARAANAEQAAQIGRQSGGRVFLFYETDDFARDYAAFLARGVVFRRPPKEAPWGTVAVFEDLYGNLCDLIEPRKD